MFNWCDPSFRLFSRSSQRKGPRTSLSARPVSRAQLRKLFPQLIKRISFSPSRQFTLRHTPAVRKMTTLPFIPPPAPLPPFSSPLYSPQTSVLDYFKLAAASHISTSLGVDLDKAYESIESGKTGKGANDGDFVVAVARFRLPKEQGTAQERAVECAGKVSWWSACFLGLEGSRRGMVRQRADFLFLFFRPSLVRTECGPFHSIPWPLPTPTPTYHLSNQ